MDNPPRLARWGLLTALALSATPRLAWACASCACGDPTLTVMGTSKPFAGRLILGTEARARWLSSGREGIDLLEMSEQRVTLEGAWAPLPELFVSLRVPLVRRDLKLADLSRASLANVGDVELNVKGFIWQDRAFNPDHLFAVDAGLELPTSPYMYGPGGEDLGFEAQLGTGSFDPSIGASYAWFGDEVSIFGSVRGIFPTQGEFGARPGSALLATVVGQVAVSSALALRAGADLRHETPFVQDDQTDPHSGGTALFATPEVLWSPLMDLTVRLAVSIPAVLDLRGTQTEGPTIRLGLVLDV